jgi:hypothetical protein
VPHKGYLEGTQHQPREIASLCHDRGWRDLDLVTAVAVCLAESQGFDHAHCDNFDDAGTLLSRDHGLFQINVRAPLDADAERLYELGANLDAAWQLYSARGWQPWHAYTSGIALSPTAAGRYVHKAVRGVANFHGEHFELAPVPLVDFRN